MSIAAQHLPTRNIRRAATFRDDTLRSKSACLLKNDPKSARVLKHDRYVVLNNADLRVSIGSRRKSQPLSSMRSNAYKKTFRSFLRYGVYRNRGAHRRRIAWFSLTNLNTEFFYSSVAPKQLSSWPDHSGLHPVCQPGLHRRNVAAFEGRMLRVSQVARGS
jgi:hypothetical protein